LLLAAGAMLGWLAGAWFNLVAPAGQSEVAGQVQPAKEPDRGDQIRKGQ
jgi:hypothetical protein